MDTFNKVVHWGGIVITKTLAFVHIGRVDLDKYAPEIEKALIEGASVAQFIPNVGPEVAAGLNFGAELVGAADKTLNFVDDEFQAIVAAAKLAVPAGYSVIVIPAKLEADGKAFLDSIKPQLTQVKASAQAFTGKLGAPASK